MRQSLEKIAKLEKNGESSKESSNRSYDPLKQKLLGFFVPSEKATQVFALLA